MRIPLAKSNFVLLVFVLIAIFGLTFSILTSFQDGGRDTVRSFAKRQEILHRTGADAGRFFEGSFALPLCQAIEISDRSAFNELLDSAVVNERGTNGMTPLLWALACRQDEMAIELLKKGASPDAKLASTIVIGPTVLAEGDSFLFAALNQLQHELFFRAFEFTADPGQCDKQGSTLLIVYSSLMGITSSGAVGAVESERIKRLVDGGVDVDAQGVGGSTALHVVFGWCPQYAPLLIELGADPTIENDDGKSVLDLLGERLKSKPTNHSYDRLINALENKGYSTVVNGSEANRSESIQAE